MASCILVFLRSVWSVTQDGVSGVVCVPCRADTRLQEHHRPAAGNRRGHHGEKETPSHSADADHRPHPTDSHQGTGMYMCQGGGGVLSTAPDSDSDQGTGMYMCHRAGRGLNNSPHPTDSDRGTGMCHEGGGGVKYSPHPEDSDRGTGMYMCHGGGGGVKYCPHLTDSDRGTDIYMSQRRGRGG